MSDRNFDPSQSPVTPIFLAIQNIQLSWRSRVYLLALAVTFLGGCSLPKFPQNREPPSTPQLGVNPLTQSNRTTDINRSDPNFVVTAVQKVGSAVVRINAARTVSSQAPDEFDDPMMRGFLVLPHLLGA